MNNKTLDSWRLGKVPSCWDSKGLFRLSALLRAGTGGRAGAGDAAGLVEGKGFSTSTDGAEEGGGKPWKRFSAIARVWRSSLSIEKSPTLSDSPFAPVSVDNGFRI